MSCQITPWAASGLMATTLAPASTPAYTANAPAKSGAGLGRPTKARRTCAPFPTAGAFFVPARSCYGGVRWDTFGCAGCLASRSANPAHAVTPTCLAASGDGSETKQGTSPMNHTQVTPKIRPHHGKAEAHRRMALAALRGDHSLSVRLTRYNHHMTKARAIEAARAPDDSLLTRLASLVKGVAHV